MSPPSYRLLILPLLPDQKYGLRMVTDIAERRAARRLLSTVSAPVLSEQYRRCEWKRSLLMRIAVPIYASWFCKSAGFGARAYVNAAMARETAYVSSPLCLIFSILNPVKAAPRLLHRVGLTGHILYPGQVHRLRMP